MIKMRPTMFSIFDNNSHRYKRLKTGESELPKVSNLAWGTKIIILAFVCLETIIVFLAGRNWPVSAPERSPVALASTLHVFKFDPNFAAAPSNESNAAWASIFPEQGGFFRHPLLAKERSAFAVFHQLHCLDGIRKGYYLAYQAVKEGRVIQDGDLPFMLTPVHIRHCIDILRQSLMCQPDLTIEIKNETVGGVTGFGTEHVCTRWDELVDWTSKWQGWRAPESD